jgi:hypothetical protein
MNNGPRIYIPRWERRASGLVLPRSVEQLLPFPGPGIPSDLLPKPGPVVVVGKPPDFMAQIEVFVDEAGIGGNKSSLTDLEALAGDLPFEPAMLVLAGAAGKAFGLHGDRKAELELAREVYSDEIYERIVDFFTRHPNAELWSEQQVFILQRLVIEHARDGVLAEGMNYLEQHLTTGGIIAAGSLISAAVAVARDPSRDVEDWLAFFVQNGAYNAKARPLGELARAQEIYTQIARLPEMADAVCPIDEWMCEDYHFTIEEQLTIGFALAAMTNTWNEDLEAGTRPRIVPEHLDDLLAKLGFAERKQELLDLVSAERTEYAAEFAEAGTEIEKLAWETRPLMRHPFLRTEDGSLLLLSPRAIQSWLTDGFHYRLLGSAQKRSASDPKRKTSRRYTAYMGELVEAHVLGLVRSSYGERPIGSGRVYGDQPYETKDGEAKTSDVAIDLGLDLVLIEVSGSRLRAETLLEGSADSVGEDLKRMLVAKIIQLHGCIDALLDGSAETPAGSGEVDLSRIERIWPVVVSAGAIVQNGLVWHHVREKTTELLEQAKVQPPTLLDLEDLEQLLGLVESGRDICALLAGKTTGPYRDLELAIYLNEAPGAPRERPRPEKVEASWQAVIERAQAMIDLTKGIAPDATTDLLPGSNV